MQVPEFEGAMKEQESDEYSGAGASKLEEALLLAAARQPENRKEHWVQMDKLSTLRKYNGVVINLIKLLLILALLCIYNQLVVYQFDLVSLQSREFRV